MPPPPPIPSWGADQIDTGTVSRPVDPSNYHGVGAVDPNRIDTAAANYDPYWSEYARQQAAMYGTRPGAGSDSGNQNAARQYQDQLIQSLHTLASGDRNSAAQQSLRQGYDAARGQARSLATTRRNVGAGAAQRGAQRQSENLTAQQSGQSEALMLQQQRAAEQALAQLYAQQRAQDIAYAQQNAQTQLSNTAMNQQAQQQAAQLGLGYDLGQQNQGGQLASAQLGFNLNQQDINQQYMNALAGAGAAGAATAGQVFGSWGAGMGRGGGDTGPNAYDLQYQRPQGPGMNPNELANPWGGY